MVIWSARNATLALPKPPLACFDHLGRPQPVTSAVLKISEAPLYAELASGTRLPMIPPPKPSKVLTGRPDPIVIQALFPQKDIVLNDSAYKMPEGKSLTVPLYVYNFGAKTVHGKLQATIPQSWSAELPREIIVQPGGREELSLRLTHPDSSAISNAVVQVTGHFGGSRPVVSFHLTQTK